MRPNISGCDQGGAPGGSPQSSCPSCFAMKAPTMGQTDQETTQATDPGVNFDTVISNVMIEDGVLPAVMIPFAIAQCRLESNNYTSNVFKSCNNLNGYKVPAAGLSQWQDSVCLQSPELDYYGHYASVENSAHELSSWWARRRDQDGLDLSTITSVNAYVSALAAHNWFTSSPTAYTARMTAVGALVSLQSATGISTQGINYTVLAVAGGALLVALLA